MPRSRNTDGLNFENPTAETHVWLTPPALVERLGPFDLDPCAAIGQPWRTAAQQFTEEDDGLKQVWKGFVWCNPPYGPHTKVWLKRMVEHGNGIALVFSRVETFGFFAGGWTADAALFLPGRLSFHHPDGTLSVGKPAANVLLAYGVEACTRLYNAGLAGCYVYGKEILTGDRIN